MKIAFIVPGYGNHFCGRRKGDVIEYFGHGLPLLSACAKQHGHEIFLIDLRVLSNWDEYAQKLAQLRPEVIGITVMTLDFAVAMKAAEIAKRTVSATVVVGGIHPTLEPQQVAAYEDVDHIVRGEGEISFVELLALLHEGKKPERIIRGKRCDLDSLPFEDRALFDRPEKPIIFKALPLPYVSIIVGRGCCYHCTFCQPAERILFGEHVRKRSVDNVMGELKFLREKIGFQSLMIDDDCLTVFPKWVEEFCQKYRHNGFTQPWACQVRADHVCRYTDLIKHMYDAGLRKVHVGFESGNQRILDMIKKGVTVEQNYEAWRILNKMGIGIFGMFMLGFPGETRKETEDTIRMIKRRRLEVTGIAFFTPYPGTELYEYCKQHDLLAITDYSDYDRVVLTPKIKGVDYHYLGKKVRSTFTVTRRLKNRIKSMLIYFFGEPFVNSLKMTRPQFPKEI